jgi:hypothetical protein
VLVFLVARETEGVWEALRASVLTHRHNTVLRKEHFFIWLPDQGIGYALLINDLKIGMYQMVITSASITSASMASIS